MLPSSAGVLNVALIFAVLLVCNCNVVDQQSSSMEDAFRQCLISQSPRSGGLGQCLGMSAISRLQTLDNEPEFDLIDGLRFERSGQEYREAYNFAESNPADFRSLLDSFSHVFTQRSLNWDMGFLYPGLAMRVAPSGGPGGMLEFILDPHREAVNAHSLKEYSTGRLMARQFLLPFLLGFKFNIATIIPILFGVLALLAKKAVVVSKIALIITSALGLGSLLLGGGNKFQQNYHQHSSGVGGGFNPGFGGHYNRFPEEEYQDVLYRGMNNVNANANPDQLKLYANLQNIYDREDKAKGRNFAWNDDEKIKKQSDKS